MVGSPTTNGEATTYNGTATISLKQGPVKDVPISIKLIGTSVVNFFYLIQLRLKATLGIPDLWGTVWDKVIDGGRNIHVLMEGWVEMDMPTKVKGLKFECCLFSELIWLFVYC
jgi:hypothetical protein